MPSLVGQDDDRGGVAAEAGVLPSSFPIVATPDFLVTYDIERTEHIISDEQLMQLARAGSDISLEVCLAALGICAGFAQNLYAIILAIKTSAALGAWDAFGAFVCVSAITAAIFNGMGYRAARRDSSQLVGKIKGRKRGRIPTSSGASSNSRNV